GGDTGARRSGRHPEPAHPRQRREGGADRDLGTTVVRLRQALVQLTSRTQRPPGREVLAALEPEHRGGRLVGEGYLERRHGSPGELARGRGTPARNEQDHGVPRAPHYRLEQVSVRT